MKKIIISISILFLAVAILLFSFYFYSLSPVSDSNAKVLFEVKEGSGTNNVIELLKSKNLIKNKLFTKVYMKFNQDLTIKAGTYELSANLSTKEIIAKLDKGDTLEKEGIRITFVEGKRIKDYVTIISNNFKFTEEDILARINNQELLDSLIDKYWFLTDEIYDKDIYYPLEGYLYPDTYYFDIDSTIDDIIMKMLDNMESKISFLKVRIESSKYTFHEILSLASDIELEGNTEDDRKLIAGVFLNRLDKGMSLGSDVTTYYAVSKSMKEELWYKDLNTNNAYNTRGPNMNGKINVGPICNPSISSIKAVIEPTDSDYLYFYADYLGDNTVYYSKTLSEHQQTVSRFEN